MKQLALWKNPGKSHGGEYGKGRRKSARPIATRRPMHVILRSSRARGEWNFLRFERTIQKTIHETARRFHIRVYRAVNVGNHLHLAIQAQRREDFQNFLRVLPQKIAFLATKTRKGRPIGRFWDHLACSRIVEWGRDWKNLRAYLEKNRFEAKGIPRDVVDWWFASAPG